jgi:xylulose-5-phosphate/fructose-6-phosphate phosphoketolase
VVRNDLDRFHLAIDVIDRVPGLASIGAHAKQAFRDRLIAHRQHIQRLGDDPPEIRDWRWTGVSGGGGATGERGRPAGQPAGTPQGV